MSKRALGRTKQRFEIRPGVSGVTQFVGVMTEGDPASIPAYALQRGLNLRRDGIHWGCRPGLTLANGSPFQSADVCVKDLSNFACDPLRIYFVTFGCTGTAGPLGASLLHYDPEQDPALQVFAQYFSSANKRICLGTYNGRIYLGDLANLRLLVLMPTPVGETATAIVGAPPDSTIHSFTSTFQIKCLQEFDGKLFIGIDQGAGVGSVWIYNGLSIIQDVSGISPPTAFCLWRDQLAMSFVTSVGQLHLRPAGDPGTAWTTVAAAGAGAWNNGNSMVSFRDKIYMADGDDEIWEYDGAALTSVRTIAGAGDLTSGVGVSSVAVLNDLLYYAWNADATGNSAVGQFDDTGGPAEWIDSLKNLQAQFANGKHAQNMVSYRNTLYVAFHDSILVSSPGLVISGTWTGAISSATSNFGIVAMKVY